MGKRDPLKQVMHDFQRSMQDMGLGMSIQFNGEKPVTVTTYCEKHGVSPGATCPECAAQEP